MFMSLLRRFPTTRSIHTLLDPTRGLSDESRQVFAAAASFAASEMAPNMTKWDEEEFFPVETLRKAASLGFAGKWIIFKV